MSDQETMNGTTAKRSPVPNVGRNLAGMTHDLISLTELQCQLVAVDLEEATSKSLLPVILIAVAILLALGTMPVALLGIGWAFVTLGGYSEGTVFLMVSLVALVVAGGIGWLGVIQLRSAVAVMKRSQRELKENVRWVKQALLTQDTRADLYRRRV